MRIKQLAGFVVLALGALLVHACAMATKKTPVVTFPEYALDAGPAARETKEDVTINIEPLRISDIYNYPDLFGFRLQDFQWPADYPNPARRWPEGPQGLSWEYPFASGDGQEQLSLFWVRIDNNTDHILRMKDARVYLITEQREPVPAVTSLEELLGLADYFEGKQGYNVPSGFYRNLVMSHGPAYKLVNGLGTEVLPGFSFEGLLVFLVFPRTSPTATVSFFDITTKVDNVGNPLEKTRFDFGLSLETMEMWYDSSQRMWKKGTPPATGS